MRTALWCLPLLLGACATANRATVGGPSTPPPPSAEPAQAPNGPTTTISVIEESEATVKPRLLSIGNVRYPPSLESARRTGCVVLRYIVTEEGTADPGSIQILRRSDPAFEVAARQLVRTSRYAPGELDGRKVRVWVKQTVHFTDPDSDVREGGCLRGV